MSTAVRILAALPGLLMLTLGLRWTFDPAGAAKEMGMPLLDGLGRSTQIGDLSAFFLATAAIIALGVIGQKRHWFQASALLIGGVAVMRAVAWAFHGADFATEAITAEVIMTAVLLFAASKAPAGA